MLNEYARMPMESTLQELIVTFLVIYASSMQILVSFEHCDLVPLMIFFSTRTKVYHPPVSQEAAEILFNLDSAATQILQPPRSLHLKKMKLEHIAFGGCMSPIQRSLPLHPEWKYSPGLTVPFRNGPCTIHYD